MCGSINHKKARDFVNRQIKCSRSKSAARMFALPIEPKPIITMGPEILRVGLARAGGLMDCSPGIRMRELVLRKREMISGAPACGDDFDLPTFISALVEAYGDDQDRCCRGGYRQSPSAAETRDTPRWSGKIPWGVR